MRQYRPANSVVPHVLVLGVPIAGLVAAFGLATSFVRTNSKTMAYVAIVALSFFIGGAVGLVQHREERFAFLNEADCSPRIPSVTIDVLQESIDDVTTANALLIGDVPLKDADGNVKDRFSADAFCAAEDTPNREDIRTVPHVFVLDGYNRLVEIREIKTTE